MGGRGARVQKDRRGGEKQFQRIAVFVQRKLLKHDTLDFKAKLFAEKLKHDMLRHPESKITIA